MTVSMLLPVAVVEMVVVAPIVPAASSTAVARTAPPSDWLAWTDRSPPLAFDAV